MNKIETAKSIIAISKSFRAFTIGDPSIAMYFSASQVAGRAGLLASAVKSHRNLESARFGVMAAHEGFSPIELRSIVYPWLEKKLLCAIERVNGDIFTITSLILTYDQLLEAVYDLWEELQPHDVDRACVQAHNACNRLPIGRAELAQNLTREFGEQTALLSIELLNAYRLVSKTEHGLIEPLYYSNSVWSSETVEQAAKSLSLLNVTEKEILLAMIEKVKNHQGIPEKMIADFASSQNSTHLLQLAKRAGLLDSTKIKSANGIERSFLVSPHFYADVAEQHGEDFCDRVKIFLDSIRNGQYFGRQETGRISDPARLLEVLLDRGWVGPATAIGSEYILPEKAGIIKVQRDPASSWKYKLHSVQSDTIGVVRQLIMNGTPEPGSVAMRAANFQPETGFYAIETIRAATVGEPPQLVLEAEADLMRIMRETGCRKV